MCYSMGHIPVTGVGKNPAPDERPISMKKAITLSGAAIALAAPCGDVSSRGIRCELPAGHDGAHYYSEAPKPQMAADPFYENPVNDGASREDLLEENRTLRAHIAKLHKRYQRAQHSASMQARDLKDQIGRLEHRIEHLQQKCDSVFNDYQCELPANHLGQHQCRDVAGLLAGSIISWAQMTQHHYDDDEYEADD